MSLEKDIVVSNLGESVFSDLAKQLREQVAGQTKLSERLSTLERAHKEMIQENQNNKKKWARGMVEQHKRQMINSTSGTPRTNAWNYGDYVKLREPPKKKKKKKKPSKVKK